MYVIERTICYIPRDRRNRCRLICSSVQLSIYAFIASTRYVCSSHRIRILFAKVCIVALLFCRTPPDATLVENKHSDHVMRTRYSDVCLETH